MSKSATLSVLCLALCSFGATAADLTVRSQLIQSVTADSNYQMRPSPPGPTFLPVSTLLFDAVARIPDMRFTTNGYLTYRSYFGPGADDLVPGLDRGFVARAEKFTADSTFAVAGSMQFQQASAVQLAETGFATRSGDVLTNWVEGLFTHQFDAANFFSWTTRSTSTEFTSDAPGSSDLFTTATWRHRLTPLVNVISTGQVELVGYNNPADTKVTIYRAPVAVTAQLTKRLRMDAAVGPVYLTLNQDAVNGFGDFVQFGSFNPRTVTSASALSWIGNYLLDYKLTSRNNFTFVAARAIGPNTLGTIQATNNIGASLSHAINHYSTVNFSAQWSHQSALAGTTDLYSGGVGYSRTLAPDWYMDLSYRMRHRTGAASEPAFSSAVFFSIRRALTLVTGGTERKPSPVIEDPLALMASPGEWAVARRLDVFGPAAALAR